MVAGDGTDSLYRALTDENEFRLIDAGAHHITISHLTLMGGCAREYDGGAILVQNHGSVTIDCATLLANKAYRGGAIATDISTYVYAAQSSTKVTMQNGSVLDDNSAFDAGGAIFAVTREPIIIDASTLLIILARTEAAARYMKIL